MIRRASSRCFGGLAWLVVVSIPLQADSVNDPASRFNGKALIRGEEVRGAGMGRGQHIDGTVDDGRSERASVDSDVHRRWSGSLIGAFGKNPPEPLADPGIIEGPPEGFQNQSVAGDPPGEKPSTTEQPAVNLGPGSELAWDDDNIAKCFKPYMEELGTPLGPGPYNFKLVIGKEFVKRQHSIVYVATVLSSTAQHLPVMSVEALDYGNMRGTLNAEAQFWFMNEFREAMKDPEYPNVRDWLEPLGFVSTHFLITQEPFDTVRAYFKNRIAKGTDKWPPLYQVYGTMKHLLLSLGLLHQQGIAHRRVGLGVLVFVKSPDGRTRMALTEFGSACVFEKTGTLVRATLADDYPCDYSVGEPDFMPPDMPLEAELDESQRNTVAKQDVWAAGLMFLLLLDPTWAGNSIFEGEGETLAPGIPDRLHKEPEYLIDELLVQRTDLKTSPRGKHLVDVLRTMLLVDPTKRASANECLRSLTSLPMEPWDFEEPEPPAAAA